MDNPQHYQPLSHALHPPHAQYSSTPAIYDPKSTTNNNNHRQEEEEEEEEDDDDEGVVEQQLNQNEPELHASNPASPQSRPGTQQDPQHAGSQESGTKRRPGRPRGSKNRKPRTGTTAVKQQESQFYYQGLQPGAESTPPQHPDINAQNQQYYEFQWRVLNLCAEFYNAAEELVKGTPPLVIAQSYQMGPSNKVDPLVMLGDAKRICDNLLANPSQLITSPPPPMYTIVPPIYQPVQPQPTATTSTTTSAASTSKAASSSTAPVISNPQSFVVSLGSAQPSYPQYPMYTPAGQYPTASYYPQYSAYASHGTPYYTPTAQQPATQPTQQQQQPTQTPQASTSALAASPAAASATTIAGAPATGAGVNQGAWADEETERLKKLAEESRSVGGSGEIEWDWVVHQWGNGRTRHQILIKATSLGLKESTSRGTKRRRGDDGDVVASPSTPTITASSSTATTTSAPSTAVPPSTSASTAPVPLPTTTSPTSSTTPGPSPALTHTQRPPPPLKTSSTSSLPWPMPTVAANTPSPIAQVHGSPGEQQRTSYYRPRPSDVSAGPGKSIQPGAGTQHQYMYQPNGSVGTSRLGKENGN